MVLTGFFALWAVSLCLVAPAVILIVLILNLRGRNNNALAIFSLVTGILGFFLLPITGSIAAIVSGNIALSAYRQEARLDANENENLARTGVILGWIGLAVWILGVIGIFLFFYPITAVRS